MNFDLVDIPKALKYDANFVRKHIVGSVGPWKIQVKKDGHRRVLHKDMDNKIHAYGTRFSDVTGHREDVIDQLGANVRRLAERLPRGYSADGEAHTGEGTSSDVPSLMKTDSELLQWTCFGFLHVDEKTCTDHIEQQEALSKSLLLPWIESHGFNKEWCQTQFKSYLTDLEHSARDKGLEGWIVKGHPAYPMAKIKLGITVDLIVCGSKAANEGKTGKYLGLIGALECKTADGVVVCFASGMNDEQRVAFSKDLPLGQVVEIEAQGLASNGRLRHPRFKRLRPDKGPAEANTRAQIKEMCG